MKILKYQNFINERLGVADDTLPYTNVILNKVFDEFEIFLKSEDQSFEKKEVFKEILNPMITDRFPISEIRLDITFTRLDNDAFVKRFPTISVRGKNFTTTGLCYGIGEEGGSEELEDGTIMLVMGTGGIINQDKFANDADSMRVELESAISHELNHSFEGYNRHKSGAPGLSTSLTFALDENAAHVPESVWMIWWKELGYYIYWTESFELNAMIQDAFPYAKKYSFEEFKLKAPSWDFYQRMSKFNPTTFKSRLISEIGETMPDSDPLQVLNSMKNGLSDTLSKSIEDSKNEEGDPTEISSIDPKLIKNLSFDKFIEYCNRRIKRGAEKLRRGVIRHYSR